MIIFVIKYISMNISKNLFDLTEDQEKTSRSIYNGKVIKCLVAPYHTYDKLEKVIPYTKTTLLFPEREMSTTMIKGLISMIVANPSQDEFRIITTNQNIIMDMVGDCVRVLTEGGDIVYTGTKTFMANIHDIRYELLENDNHRLSESERTESQNKIKTIINRVNDKTPITRTDFTQLISEIDLIGEPIIKNKLKEMSRNLTIV
jgi:hypothetical protein